MKQATRVSRRVTDAVNRSADAAEEIHQSVANFPLSLLERVEGLEDAVGGVRKVQKRSITAVYDLVRGINREVGKLADDLIAGPPKKARPRPRKKPVRRAKHAGPPTAPPVQVKPVAKTG